MPTPETVALSEHLEIDVERRELRIHGRAVPVGGRAFELLEVLVAAANELVTKEHLMARVWPGAIVEENTLHVHMSAIRKSLGADRGLLQTASGRGYRLLGRWTVRQKDAVPMPEVAAAAPSPRAAIDELPLAASELFGRSEAIQHVSILLSAYRVVTLTGPGGIGKSSLALQVARQSAGAFQDGAHFVELATIADPALVPATIARALNLSLGTGQVSAQSVATVIGERAMLLVLDNCEHLIDAVAFMADALIRICPNVSTIATSRELLRIEGEYVQRVPPLSLPPADTGDRSELLRHGAVRLFVARTRAAGLDLCAEGNDLRAVGAICRRLDGIPLAIEFAAARAATLGPDHVLARLEDRFAHLTVGRRTALPRHQTLRATLDWSYDLLTAEERCLLRRLAVFAGGFTLDAVAAVMRGPADAGAALAEGLSTLVAKSLVTAEGTRRPPRWRLLETIRAYAFEQLNAAGEARDAARRHAEHYRDVVEARPVTTGGLAVCAEEINNVRAALDWAFADSGDPGIGVALTAGYVPVWLHLFVLPECREAIERALGRCGPAVEPRILMRLNIALGLLLSYTPTGYVRSIEDVLSEGLGIAESLGDVESQVLALWGLVTLRAREGDHRAAKSLATSIRIVAERSGAVAEVALGNRALGTSLHYTGEQSAARPYLERIVDLPAVAMREDYEALLLTDLRIQSRAILARVLLLQGLADQARTQARMSYELALHANHRMSICFTLRYAVCATSLTLGDLTSAGAAVASLLDAATTFNFGQAARQGRCLEAMLAIRQGDHVGGTEQLKSAIDANMSGGFSLCYPEMLGVLAEGFAGLHREDDARATLATAVAWSERTGETWYLPELFRLEGELALRFSADGAQQAETCFVRAMTLAREQDALLWELRAACGLARLRLEHDRPADVHGILRPLLARMTEGHDTSDVQSARSILSRLV